MPATAIDKDTIKQRYREERDKRLRPDGNAQYIEIKEQFDHYLTDPYTPFVEREPKRDHVTFAFIGGGFAGLVTGARLVEQGVTDVRIIEKGGDFAGTWYWNRYPGAMCDTAAMIYMPLLEETGHMPSEKYAHAPEILAHCQNIGRQYKLYDNALFHTEVNDLEWDGDNHRWIVRTNRGDEFTAQYLGIGTGPLHVAKLPGLDGITDFTATPFTRVDGTTTTPVATTRAPSWINSATSEWASLAPARRLFNVCHTSLTLAASCTCSSARRLRSMNGTITK